MRLVAAISIVWFHAPGAPYQTITITGLVYFLLLTFCLQGMNEAKGNSFPVGDRARRLLAPWVVWSAFYGLVEIVRPHPFTRSLYHQSGALLIGPEIHLWFLPFAFFAGAIAFWLKKAVLLLSETGALIALLLVAGALTALFGFGRSSLPAPFGQWLYSSPLLPLGLAIGMAQRLPKRRLAGHYVAIVVGTVAMTWTLGELAYLLGVVTLLIAVLPRTRDMPALRWLAGLSLGIYLIHPFVFLLMHKYFPGSSWTWFVLVGVLASAATSAVIASIPSLGSLAFGTLCRPPATPTRSRSVPKLAGPSEAPLGEPAH